MKQKDRILLGLDVFVQRSHSPERNIGSIRGFIFMIVDRKSVMRDQLFCIKYMHTNSQEHMLMSILIWADHSF